MNLYTACKIGLAAGLLSASVAASDLSTEKERVSYMIGMDMANQLFQIKDEIDVQVMMRAVSDVLGERETALTPEQADQVRNAFIEKLQNRAAEEQAEIAKANREEGERFLAENGRREGVITTESGLQYEVLRAGDGPRPSLNDQVRVHYVGTLIDGTKFDSSYDRGQPATFPLNGVIAGWTEALQLMPVGSKYKLFIPSDLAYGDRGTPGPIGPNATLIFEVELLEILN